MCRIRFIYRSLLVLALCMLGLTATGNLSAQEIDPKAVQMLADSVMQRGELVIRTGEFEFDQKSVDTPPTDEAIKQRIATTTTALQKAMDKTDNEDLRARYQKAIDNIDAEVRPQMMANASRDSKYRLALGSARRYIAFAKFDKKKKTYQPEMEHLDWREGANISFMFDHAHGGSVTIHGKGAYLGIDSPHQLGRAEGALASIAADMKGDQFALWLREAVGQITVAKLPNKDIETFEVRCQLLLPIRGVDSFRYQIVPSRGYITPLVEELDAKGKVVQEWKSKDYFQPQGQELWFPKECTYQATKMAFRDSAFKVYSFDEKTVTLNTDIPKERLSILIPAKQSVHDARDFKNQKNYRAVKEVTMSLGDLKNLHENESFEEYGIGVRK